MADSTGFVWIGSDTVRKYNGKDGKLVAAIERVCEAVKKGAGCRLALPLNHAGFPRNAAELRHLGAGYTNCAPTPEARLLRSMQEQCAAQRKLLG